MNTLRLRLSLTRVDVKISKFEKVWKSALQFWIVPEQSKEVDFVNVWKTNVCEEPFVASKVSNPLAFAYNGGNSASTNQPKLTKI